MKTQLTVEESDKLIKLGVDAKLASKHTLGTSADIPNVYRKVDGGKPIFTLSDLLSILPKEINGSDLGMEYDSEFQQWWAGYNAVSLEPAHELIDALYQLLIWVLKNNHGNICS